MLCLGCQAMLVKAGGAAHLQLQAHVKLRTLPATRPTATGRVSSLEALQLPAHALLSSVPDV